MDALAPARRELVQNAVLFLNDPQVQSSSLQSRLDFLTSKHLTEPEIQLALSLAQQGAPSTSASTAPPAPPQHAYSPRGLPHRQEWGPPQVPGRDWRDWFIMAVVSGGVVYGLSTLARKYLVPHLQPPSSTSFQQTSSALTEQYDRAASLLSTIEARADALTEHVRAEHAKVDRAVEDVEDAVRAVRAGEDRWREDLRDVRAEVDGIRELVPRMIDKHTAAQSAALADLQIELRSLRALLVARQPDVSASRSATTSPPPWASASAHNGHSGHASPPTGQHAAADRLLKGQRGIPAWQLAPATKGAGQAEDKAEDKAEDGDGKAGKAGKADEAGADKDEAEPSGLQVEAQDHDQVGLA
ncbi:peroxisomal membrane protein pex14 [Cryptotrichosporon argae]